jgi:hypothetical protein
MTLTETVVKLKAKGKSKDEVLAKVKESIKTLGERWTSKKQDLFDEAWGTEVTVKTKEPKIKLPKKSKNPELDAALQWYSAKYGGGQGPKATPDQIIAMWKKATGSKKEATRKEPVPRERVKNKEKVIKEKTKSVSKYDLYLEFNNVISGLAFNTGLVSNEDRRELYNGPTKVLGDFGQGLGALWGEGMNGGIAFGKKALKKIPQDRVEKAIKAVLPKIVPAAKEQKQTLITIMEQLPEIYSTVNGTKASVDDVGEPIGNFMLFIGKIYKSKPEIDTTQDGCKVYTYFNGPKSGLPKLYVILDKKTFLYARIKDNTYLTLETLKTKLDSYKG